MEQEINYNEEPVHYCKYCLSLDNPVVLEGTDLEYCKYCGSTDFEESSIEDWEKQFEEKYKQGKYLKINAKWKTIMQSMNKDFLQK
jgi:hypothetical protein